MMAVFYIALMMWLPLCSRASTEQPMGSTDFTTAEVKYSPVSSPNTNASFECYSCLGVVGEVTNCGESLTAEEDLAVVGFVQCNTVCTKAVRYKIDQKIYVARNCSESCDPGCTVRGGTGTCWYCCEGNLCNGAETHPNMSLFIILTCSLATPFLSWLISWL